MADLYPVTIDDQIAAVVRECAMRRQVYPRRVADRKMSPDVAARQIALMDAVLATLKGIKARGG